MTKIKLSLFVIAIALAPAKAFAGDYAFTVSCVDRHFVVEWGIGTIDPGKEYLRVMTGVRNPNCSITDYNPALDGHLPKDRYAGAGGVLQGTPPISILCGIFRC